jgi:hypothetical protein
MPFLIPSDTRAVLGEDAEKCESRSLFMDRFALPGAQKEERKKWFDTSSPFAGIWPKKR